MDNKEKLKLASELLELLNEETEISEAAVYKETETEVNTVIEKASITETEYIARRRDMEELSDFSAATAADMTMDLKFTEEG